VPHSGQVAKMTFWVRNAEARQFINPEWLQVFPDPQSRPARHTLQNDHMAANLLVQCDALAVISPRTEAVTLSATTDQQIKVLVRTLRFEAQDVLSIELVSVDGKPLPGFAGRGPYRCVASKRGLAGVTRWSTARMSAART